MYKIAIFLAVMLVHSLNGDAQYQNRIDSLKALYNKAANDSQKVVILGELAAHYYIYHLDSLARNTLHQQLVIAEIANNKNLMLLSLFGDATSRISYAASSLEFDKCISFIESGIDYAESNGLRDYVVLGYLRLSDILRKRGDNTQALSNAVLALSNLKDVDSDSIKALTYLGLGNAYLALGKAETACFNYNNAFDFATKIPSVTLQSKTYHCLSEMYRYLGDSTEAHLELNKSVELNRSNNNQPGLLNDYIDLARLTDKKEYIDKAIELAWLQNDSYYLLISKRIMLAYYQVAMKDANKALQFLETEPDLKMTYINSGIGNYYRAIGNCYFYAGIADSALRYYQLAEPEILKQTDPSGNMVIFYQLGDTYALAGNHGMAITYYHKALQLSETLEDEENMAGISAKLSNCYELQKDFKNAFLFAKRTTALNEQLRAASEDRKIALLGVARENRKHELELLQKEKQENAKMNIQYMFITLVIVIVFFIMLIIGSFTVSKMMIKMMGYFFFISVFEFIVLLIDSLFLAHHLHNQPLKLWIVKIFLIAMLVPLQHFLEHRVTELLSSKKIKPHLTFKKWLAKMRKPAAPGDKEIKNDALVM